MNTSNLTPMRDLILLKTFGLSHHDKEQKQWIIPDEELEAIRQAIILDMVSKLEPSAYIVVPEFTATNVLSWEIPDENWKFFKRKAEKHTPLYDLSAFKDTPK